MQIECIRKTLRKKFKNVDGYIEIAMGEAVNDVTIKVDYNPLFFEASVVTAVRNKLINEYQRKKKFNRLPKIDSGDTAPELHIESNENRIVDDISFQEHLALVTIKQAEVLRMDFEEGMTNKQISKKIGITVNSVKVRKKLAFAVIRKYILKTDPPKIK